MAFTEAETTRVSVGDVAAMNDAELAHFMQKHRLPNGDYDLPVDGWDKLSRDDRSRFAERLEAQKRSLAQSPMACSRPLDLNDLDARLRRISSSQDQSFSLRRQTGTVAQLRTPTPPYDPTALEIETYHKLVRDGGRPLYHVDLIHDVYREPQKYAETLRPWQESLHQIRPEGIFQRQMQRWKDFRKWQNDNRDREDEDDGFPAYVERQKQFVQRHCLRRSRAKRLAEIEADPSCLLSDWEDEQWERERQRRLYREHGCRDFYDYTEAVKRRLTSHGFTHSFKLDEDPKKQDRLTTWIEYLNYEYWWLDKHTNDIERFEPEHDKLWQELVEKNILKPHETKEFVRTDASGMEHEREKDQAKKAFQRAESEAKRIYLLTQKDPNRLRIPKAKRISMMKNGTEKLLVAKQRLEQARRRSFLVVQFVRATFDYAGAKRYAARHRVLVQWVLDQVPLIEAEVNPSKSRRPESGGGRGTKRRFTMDEEPPERRAQKRVRFDLPEPRLANARAASEATETQPGLDMVTDQEAAAQDAQIDDQAASDLHQRNSINAISQGPRRSARIAARLDACRKVLEPDISQRISRSRTAALAAQGTARQTSPAGHAKAHVAKRRSRRISQHDVAGLGRRSQRRRQQRVADEGTLMR